MARRARSPTARSPTGRRRTASRPASAVASRSTSRPPATTGCSCASTGSRRAPRCRTRSCGRLPSGSPTRSPGRRPWPGRSSQCISSAALNDDRLPTIRALGSIGQSDLAQMADLADGILGGFELARGEAITLLNQSAFSTAYGALAFADAVVLLDALDYAGALDLEALGANLDSVHPPSGWRGPTPGCSPRSPALGALLDGSEVVARDLQDPLTFRTIAQQNGAARDAFAFVGRAARDRAQCGAVESARARGRKPRDLGRQLRDATACDCARPRAARPRAGDLDRGRAHGQAPPAAADRPDGGARRSVPPWPKAPSASTGSRSRRSRSRRGSSRTRFRSSWSRRPRRRGSRTG